MTYPNELIELAFLDIPTGPVRTDGLLEIVGKQYNEVIITRLYRYFLDNKKYPEISSLFSGCLMELIVEQMATSIVLEEFASHTEVTTANQKRIDLVLDDTRNRSVIIIENKIFHLLNNDLIEYWNHYAYPEENKVGVLLTIHPLQVPANAIGKYINITHSQWIGRIKQSGLPANLPFNLYVYLNDFINSMENLTQSDKMSDQARFFFEHPSKVLAATATIAAATQYIRGQLEIAADKLGMKVLNSRYDEWWHIGVRKDVHYTIVFKDLLKGRRGLTIIIETHGDVTRRAEEIRNSLFQNESYTSNNMKHKEAHGAGWLHFCSIHYSLNSTNIEHLSDFVIDRIKIDFTSIMSKMLEIIND